MSLTEIFVKAVGVILALVGLALVLAAFGVSFGFGLPAWYLDLIVGAVLICIGVYLIRGGTISL